MSIPPFGAVVMGKAPIPGAVKTRLQLPASVAADLYCAFLWDTCRQVDAAMAQLGGGIRMFACALSDNDSVDAIRGLVPKDWILVPQQGIDLGERMRNAWRASPAKATVVMGSDIPTFPSERVVEALNVLHRPSEHSDAVFVPADDGGYMLFGLRQDAPALFEGISWSTPEVMALTEQAAARAGLRITVLKPHYDVDTPADVKRMRSDLDPDSRTARALTHYAQWFDFHTR
ncbi:MAG: TIGR04282 family arsenosugar biosynthesis glycosyltransferase [Myxococcales bacterium]|nr:TIGR04282 family arsenosugar biosynthesis glycosyltransferase [Myxococcales bacterium]